MLWFQKFFLQDIANCRRGSVPDTKDAIKAKAEEKLGVGWSYQTTENVCKKSLSGGISLAQGLAAADKLKLGVAAKNNRTAIQELQPYFSRIDARFYPLKKEDFRFGLGPNGEALSCKIKMFGLLHDGEKGCLHWVNYRLNDPTDELLRQLVASVAQQTYLIDPDYIGSALMLHDISAIAKGIRSHRNYEGDQLLMMNDDQIAAFFDPIHRALYELIEEGFQPKKPEQKKQPPKPDPDQPTLF